MVAKLITMPFRGASGRMKLKGRMTSFPGSGTHTSTPGLAALIALIPRLKCLAMSGRVSPFSSLTTAKVPITSSPPATGKTFRSISFCVGTGGSNDCSGALCMATHPLRNRTRAQRNRRRRAFSMIGGSKIRCMLELPFPHRRLRGSGTLTGFALWRRPTSYPPLP
ncbi:MAG: hypothetical protein ACD_74C00199G0001 [uncultured bacterium]|nr:MAG: hypothetical protein ACD_74C00199G0001 [uncultured bacterium]